MFLFFFNTLYSNHILLPPLLPLPPLPIFPTSITPLFPSGKKGGLSTEHGRTIFNKTKDEPSYQSWTRNPVGLKGVPRAEERVRDINTPILRGPTLSYTTITYIT